MTVFLHCSVLFELKSLPYKEKVKIKLAVTENGGTISFVPNKQCSLVVTSGVSSLSPSRLRNIVKYQIPVVGLDYVHRCLEANCRLPVEDFQLDVSSSTNAHPVVNKDKWTKDNWTKDTSKTPKSLRDESPKHGERVNKDRRVHTEMDHGLPDFPENFQVAKYAIFQKHNSNSWCLLELQSAKTENARQYSVVKYWKDDIQSKKAAVRDQVCVSTSEEALKAFEDHIETMKEQGLKQQREAPPTVTEMGSAPLQQLLLEEKLNTEVLSAEVGLFVELLWQDALGCVDHILSTPVSKISLNDVTRAEGILHQVQRKLHENKMEAMLSLWSDYCTLLPPRFPVNPNTASVSQQFNLCQVIRDILNASEMTLGSPAPSSVGKYRALRCGIEAVSPESSEFEEVTCLLQNSNMKIHQVLRVNRASELQNFKSELGNIKPLLHSSSPHNFVGILSRGLLLPHVAVDQHGIQRTDAGDLGSGIYFSDDIKTSLKYSQCSSSDGSRLMLVCDVALGQCKDLFQKDLSLTQAPEGHDSVHGVQGKPGLQSQFKDDEYVVYSADQVKLKYVMKFSLEGEECKKITPDIIQSEQPSLPSPDQGVGAIEEDLSDIGNPLENVTAGLLNSSGQQIPLQAVHVKCKLMDLLSQVIIFQKYTNGSSMPIEAKYVFPLDDLATVTGFEAFINGKHVVGQVKEKETARREYKQAIEKGHGAYLMDQDAPDVFTISVGNLPPAATVLIKVTFVSELIIRDGSIVFSLPSSVAPWQQSAALNQTTQVTVEKVCLTDEGANSREFNLDMSVEMPHEITEVKCITHKVKIKKTACKAVLSVLPGEVMGPDGFQVLVSVTEVHVPRMWVEQHPSKESQACMLVFYPKIETTSSSSSDEVVLLLDASQSMKESLNTSRTLALEILKTLQKNVRINVIFFATDHTEAFLSARPIGKARQEAKNFIKHFSSAGGSTELWRPLRVLSLLPRSSGTRNLLLLSDGHIQNPELTLQLLRETDSHTRLFTCGLSTTANRHMLRALAHAGGGAYEFFDHKSKHTWSEKVASQVKRMLAPGARSVSVKWQQFNPTAPPVQAPKQIHSLFNDCHTLVFGFVPHCTQATLLGKLSEEEINTMVSTSELQKTRGTFLHKLTARAIIRDFEDGSLDSNAILHEEKKAELKSFIIKLSKEFSILSQFTSFVAIEERDSDEERGSTDIPKLISEEDVDFLPYMRWEEAEKERPLQLWPVCFDACINEVHNVGGYALSSDSSDAYFEDGECFLDIDRAKSGILHEESFALMDTCFDDGENVEETSDDHSADLSSDNEQFVYQSHFTSGGSRQQSSPPHVLPSRASFQRHLVSAQKLCLGRKRNTWRSISMEADLEQSAPQQDPPQSDYPKLDSQVIQVEFKSRKDTTWGAPPPPPPPGRLQRASASPSVLASLFTPFGSCTPMGEGGASMSMMTHPALPASFQSDAPRDSPQLTPDKANLKRGITQSRRFSSTVERDYSPPPPPPPHVLQKIDEITTGAPSCFGNVPAVGLFGYQGVVNSMDDTFKMRPQEAPAPLQVSSFSFSLQSSSLPPFDDQPLQQTQFEQHTTLDARETLRGRRRLPSAKSIPYIEHSMSLSLPPLGDMENSSAEPFYGFGFSGLKEMLLSEGWGKPHQRHTLSPEWPTIFLLQRQEGYWELTPELGTLLNCNISRFADDFLKRKGIASLGLKAHADILKLLATLLVLQLMRLENTKEGKMLRTLFCLEDSAHRPEYWEAVSRAVKWVCWADGQYPCVYSRLEFGLSWDSSTKQLLGAESIQLWSPLKGLHLNPRPFRGPIMR